MSTDVVVLNGGSSSGKSSIARALQGLLPTPFLTFGVDTLIQAVPPALSQDAAGIVVTSDGNVLPGAAFRRLENAWYRGLAAIARAGIGIVLDEVFLGAAASQLRVRTAFQGLQVLWVGVRCSPVLATSREAARRDRVTGMAAGQADSVHVGVEYDLQVDTSVRSAEDCGRLIAGRVDA